MIIGHFWANLQHYLMNKFISRFRKSHEVEDVEAVEGIWTLKARGPIFGRFQMEVMTHKRESKLKFRLPFFIELYLYLYSANI